MATNSASANVWPLVCLCVCVSLCVCVRVCLLHTEIGFSVCSVATRHRHPASLQPLLPGRVSSLTTSTFDFVDELLLLLLAENSWWIARKNIKPIFSAYKWGRVREYRAFVSVCRSWWFGNGQQQQQQVISTPKSWPILESQTHTQALTTHTHWQQPSRQHCGHNGPLRTHTHVLPMWVCIYPASHNNNGLTTLKMCVKCARATRIVPALNGFIGPKPRPAKQWVNDTPVAAPPLPLHAGPA